VRAREEGEGRREGEGTKHIRSTYAVKKRGQDLCVCVCVVFVCVCVCLCFVCVCVCVEKTGRLAVEGVRRIRVRQQLRQEYFEHVYQICVCSMNEDTYIVV
jgi:hypothetical protein